MNELERYILKNSCLQDELMAELESVTFQKAVHPHMISGHLQGKLLEFLTRMINPRRVLEIGTFTGYSTLSIAAGLSTGAVIDTVEANDEMQEISAYFFERSPYGSLIRSYTGSALDIVPALGGDYDLAFIDGGKREYPLYYQLLMGKGCFAGHGRQVRPGAWIVADNILWYGKVAAEGNKDADTAAVDEFNQLVGEDPDLENVILPIRDGLSLIRVLQ